MSEPTTEARALDMEKYNPFKLGPMELLWMSPVFSDRPPLEVYDRVSSFGERVAGEQIDKVRRALTTCEPLIDVASDVVRGCIATDRDDPDAIGRLVCDALARTLGDGIPHERDEYAEFAHVVEALTAFASAPSETRRFVIRCAFIHEDQYASRSGSRAKIQAEAARLLRHALEELDHKRDVGLFDEDD